MKMMTELEQGMKKRGYVRCPNVSARWYQAYSGGKRPPFPLEIRVTDAIWLVTARYGQTVRDEIIPLMRFDTAEALERYIDRNGVVVEQGPNVWD
jgi:hypothetical protein